VPNPVFPFFLLLTIKPMAEQGGEIYRRTIKLTTFVPPEGLERMTDVSTNMRLSPASVRPRCDFSRCHRTSILRVPTAR
jgi:hypothetical protein